MFMTTTSPFEAWLCIPFLLHLCAPIYSQPFGITRSSLLNTISSRFRPLLCASVSQSWQPYYSSLVRGADVLRRYVGTTGKRTKIGVPAILINKPGPVWQGDVIQSFCFCVQYKEIV